jgi:hypothetical protein
MGFGCLAASTLLNIENSIKCAGFSPNYEDWHMTKHDVYGDNFKTLWQNSGQLDVDPIVLEAIQQDDELDESIFDCFVINDD